MSWSALPGTGEPVELVEERKKAKQEAMRAANADILASEAAEAAAAAARARARRGGGAVAPADAAGAARLALEAETAMCARDPDRGEWRVPVPSDGWRWRDDGVDAETLRREMDEAEGSGPRRAINRINSPSHNTSAPKETSRAARRTTRSESSAFPGTARRCAESRWTLTRVR